MWAERERREGQVCREVYLSKPVVVQEKDAIEAQEEDGMDLEQRKVCPWGMGRLCVCARVCVKQSLSLSLSLSPSLSLSRVLVQLLRTLSQCTDSHTHTPNITPTLVQRAGMPRFLRKPSSGEQGGSITSLPPPPPHTKAHASRAHMHTHKRTHTHMRMEGRGHAKGASPPPSHTHIDALKFGLRSERRGEG